MSKKSLIIILIVGGTIFLGYLGGWWEVFYKGLENTPSVVQPSKPASVMYDSELTGWDDQKRAWKIGAVKIWESSDSNQVYFEDINNGIIYTDKDGEVYFKAKWARWERARQELNISGGLEAKQKEEFFTTDQAVMKYKTEELYCPTPVRYYGKDLKATADKMTMNFEKEEVVMEGNVELVHNEDIVRSEGMVYWRNDKKFKLIKPREAIIKP